MTVKEALSYAADYLKDLTDESDNEARILVSYLTGDDYGKLGFSEKTVEKDELCRLLNKRSENIPIQYILGKWWFYKGEFFVGEGVLIPRQDTETLVETAVNVLRGKENIKVADLCAGSGCIGISIATDFPSAEVTCVEKYEKAFEYLEKNIKHNGTDNVKAVLADVCEKSFGSYDLIVSNPPYITKRDMETLSEEVKKEPETALFGGDDGLYFYERITKIWKNSLKSGGVLAFEVGIGEAAAVSEILRSAGFEKIAQICDLKNVPRVVFGTVKNI